MKRRLTAQLYRLRDELGAAGVAGIALFVAAALFMALVLEPRSDKAGALDARAAMASDAPAHATSAAAKLAALYDYLRKPEGSTDWLAKLYAIGTATGVQLAQANYKMQDGPGQLERYEIVLPLTGSYTQMREFIKRALADIPVLSLDQVSLKRDDRRQGSVQAELRMTLHMVKP
jgi:Tfp pilus assembly protein PilO